jgi:predicted TIM-barrel fold metal-dependent hydrolase
LIFGSDYYPGAIYHHPGALVEILGLNAPDAVKKEILSQTLQRLLNRQ